MAFNPNSVKKHLKGGDIKALFIEELGWDTGKSTKECKVANSTFQLKEVAKKAGFRVWLCELPDRNLPDKEDTRSVHRQLVKESYEHIIVFISKDHKSQVWLWVRREPNKQISFKHHYYNSSQDGESLTQKLNSLFISFEEEELGVDITQISGRAKKAFDIERVTKKFYLEFDKHRNIFLGFIKGIPIDSDREWYASVMLNRLMFAYFIQKKGFLNSDPDYLRRKLKECIDKRGNDHFYSFYRIFLLRLFHEGLGTKKVNRDKGLEALLGNIPYLNGGMFDVHVLEQPDRYGKTIEIKDEAFENLFAYFDEYQWYLDERPLKQDNEINPDVLGYIFEKYINQKQMGAYYTKEDITEYISKNTIIPFIFDSAREKVPDAFEAADSEIWRLLQNNPDDYIHKAIKHGIDQDLPIDIQDGLDQDKPDLLKRREPWNKTCNAPLAITSETWREVVERRCKYKALQRILSSGTVRSIDQLLTLNLDIKQFAVDVIDNCEDTELLWAIWQSIQKITVLDPTGGSGAFLFAALNILEPLYEACLERFEVLLPAQASPGISDKFRQALSKASEHPNRKYFILKSIILRNLYAVDIMDEAVEICKLRLFLKLASQVQPDPLKDNLGIEPLPDIDFNVRAGNALVGYSTSREAEAAVSLTLDFEGVSARMASLAKEAQTLSDEFKRRQLEHSSDQLAPIKESLLVKLLELGENLNKGLASELGIDVGDELAFKKWKASAKPFHWYTQFFGIMSSGGFDVIIGNPPYIEYSKKKEGVSVKDAYEVRGFKSIDADNLYAFTMERSLSLCSEKGRSGMIVPVSFVSGESYSALIDMMCSSRIWLSSYSNRPAKLFDGVEQRLTIYLKSPHPGDVYSAPYNHWYAEERGTLFEELCYEKSDRIGDGKFPAKTGKSIERAILSKMAKCNGRIFDFESRGAYGIWYHDAPTYWIRCLPFEPNIGIKSSKSNHYHKISAASQRDADIMCSILNSSIFYFHFKLISNCRDFGPKELRTFCVPQLHPEAIRDLAEIGADLGRSLRENAKRSKREYKSGIVEYEEYFPQLSKQAIDRIDEVLGACYGFTQEELDFVINYDIKYRLGRPDDEVE